MQIVLAQTLCTKSWRWTFSAVLRTSLTRRIGEINIMPNGTRGRNYAILIEVNGIRRVDIAWSTCFMWVYTNSAW